MPKASRTEIIQRDLPEVVRQWLLKKKLLYQSEEVTVRVTIASPPAPQVKVFASVESGATGENRGTRANPKEKTNPCLTDIDWDRIFAHRWEYRRDKVLLEMLRSRNNLPVSLAEVAAVSQCDWHGVINDAHITGQLKKLGLGDLRLLSDGPHCERTKYQIYRMV